MFQGIAGRIYGRKWLLSNLFHSKLEEGGADLQAAMASPKYNDKVKAALAKRLEAVRARLEELDPAGPLAAAPEPAPSARPVLGSPVAPGTRGAYAISHCHFMCYWDFPYKRE
jgi:hypothetical protein